jgi:hypothetical protein
MHVTDLLDLIDRTKFSLIIHAFLKLILFFLADKATRWCKNNHPVSSLKAS